MHAHRRVAGRLLIVGLLLAAVLSALPAARAHAQQGLWTPPHSFGPYWFPDVVADPTGRVHVVWSNSERGFDLVMYSESETGEMWSQPIDVAAYIPAEGTSEATRPTLAAAADGELYLSSRLLDVYVARASATGAGNAANWSEPESMGEGYFSRIAIDATGTLHLLYTQSTPDAACQLCYHLYATRSHDQGATWSPPIDLSLRSVGTAKPQIAIDAGGGLHVVFEQGMGGTFGRVSDPSRVMYTRSLDGGATWSAPIMIQDEAGASTEQVNDASQRNVAIAATGKSTLLAVWWSIPDDRVLSRVSYDAGETWQETQTVPGVAGVWGVYQSRLDNYALGVDSSGVVHLVMVGRRSLEQQDLALLHLQWDGSGWTQPETIVRYDDRYPEWPRLAIGLGNVLHVVWFVRSSTDVFRSDSGNYEVYYSRSVTESPAVAPITPPAGAPAAPAVVSSAQLAKTEAAGALVRLPPIDPGRRVSLDRVMTENDDVLLLGLSVLPALLLVLGVAVRRRSR